jgi:hypothetical protein
METFDSPVIGQVILVTAIINIVAVLFLLFTCRFIPGLKLTQSLTHRSGFKSLYKYHSYIWWVAIPSIITHAVLSLLHRLAEG